MRIIFRSPIVYSSNCQCSRTAGLFTLRHFFLEIRQYFCEKILLGAIISHRRSYCQSSDTPYVIFLQLSLRGGAFIRLLILLRLAVAALQRQQQLPSQQPRKALYLPRLLQIEDRVFILLLFSRRCAPAGSDIPRGSPPGGLRSTRSPALRPEYAPAPDRSAPLSDDTARRSAAEGRSAGKPQMPLRCLFFSAAAHRAEMPAAAIWSEGSG